MCEKVLLGLLSVGFQSCLEDSLEVRLGGSCGCGWRWGHDKSLGWIVSTGQRTHTASWQASHPRTSVSANADDRRACPPNACIHPPSPCPSLTRQAQVLTGFKNRVRDTVLGEINTDILALRRKRMLRKWRSLIIFRFASHNNIT